MSARREGQDDVVSFPSSDAWSAWLDDNHEGSPGVWLRIAKKGADEATVSYQEALEVALCFGWIDGQKAPFDQAHWLQRFTPRRPRSRWSKRNTELVEKLAAQGLMRPAGLREVEQAKADGRWDAAYPGRAGMQVPPEFEQELERRPAARAAFEALDSQNRFSILYRIADAKRPETRAKRIEQFVAMLEAGETLYP